MEKRVFIITFEEDSKSYQAFSEAKQMHLTKKIAIDQMAVITNKEEEKLEIKDFMDMTGPDRTSRGSLIGILIGLLGGPLGMLLGWVSGAMIGASGDAREVKNAMSAFEQTLAMISPGKTGLMIIATAESYDAIQDLVYEEIKDGRVLQLDLELVKQEIEDAKKTEQALQKEARKRWFRKEDD